MFSNRFIVKIARRSGLLIALIAALLVSSGNGMAQTTASMTGNVKDSSGAIVPGASLIIKNTESGMTRNAESDASGAYSVQSLPVGSYEITVEKEGFKQQVRRGITLTVAQQAVINLSLEVGNVEQQVTVTGEAPIVNTTLSSTSGLIGEQQVKDLPLNGRSFDQLLTLNVGTTNYTANTNHNAFSVAGKRPETARFTINGVDFIGADSSGQVITPTGASGQLLGVDAVREFNVVQHTAGAEYGKRAGGQITIVTSSGTNQLHGSAFEFIRNSKLDARNFFDQADVPAFKRNQFGGSLGGPIKKDKMFIFGNYEGFRQRLGISNLSYVPDLEARKGNLNGAPVPNLKTGMLPFFAYWPLPNGRNLGGGVAESFSSPAQKIREDFGLVRFDHTLTDKDSYSVNYNIDDGEKDDPAADPLFIAIAPQRSNLVAFQETHVFSPTVLNSATLGYSRAATQSGTPPVTPFDPSLYLISGAGPGAITIGGAIATTVGSTITSPSGNRSLLHVRNFFTYADDLHWVHGAHSISAGAWAQKIQQNLGGSPLAQGGSISYPSLTAFLQDAPTQFVAVPNPTPLGYRSTEAAFYIQDEIKLKTNLTLRLGLRDEMTTGWNEVTNRNANYFFDSNGVIQTNPLVGPSALSQNNASALWQPRAGLAWDPTGTGTWAVRAGFGIYNDLQDSLAHRISANPPYNARMTLTTPLLSFRPIAGGTQPAPSCTAFGQTNCSVFSPGGLDPTMHTPTHEEWSFTVERELTKDLMLQLSYVGSQSYHLSLSLNRNAAQPVVCNNPQGCVSGGVRTAAQTAIVPQGTTYIPSTPPNPALTLNGAAATLGPNPFVANTFSWMFAGTSNYHSGNVSLVKRAAKGLTFKMNYTFAKVMDQNSAITSSSGTNEPQMVYTLYNLKLSNGISAYSIKHQFNTNFSYELPFGHGQKWASSGVADKVLGGWQWNGIVTAQGGFPFTPQVGSNILGTGDTFNPDLPNWNPNFKGKVILGKPGQYFDPNAFVAPAPGTFGNVSRGALTGPGLTTVDMSLFKKIQLSERYSLRFQAEAFNLLNHTNFYSPSPIVFSAIGAAPQVVGGQPAFTYSTTAGAINKAATSRQLQFALKLMF